MHAEKRTRRSLRLNRDKGRRLGGQFLLADSVGELLYGWPLEKRRERKLLPQPPLDLSHQPDGKKRMPAQIEEACGHPEVAPRENVLPYRQQLQLEHVA